MAAPTRPASASARKVSRVRCRRQGRNGKNFVSQPWKGAGSCAFNVVPKAEDAPQSALSAIALRAAMRGIFGYNLRPNKFSPAGKNTDMKRHAALSTVVAA